MATRPNINQIAAASYEVDFTTLPNQNLLTGGDGNKTIDGKVWTLGNSSQANSIDIVNGTGLVIDNKVGTTFFIPQTGARGNAAWLRINPSSLFSGFDVTRQKFRVSAYFAPLATTAQYCGVNMFIEVDSLMNLAGAATLVWLGSTWNGEGKHFFQASSMGSVQTVNLGTPNICSLTFTDLDHFDSRYGTGSDLDNIGEIAYAVRTKRSSGWPNGITFNLKSSNFLVGIACQAGSTGTYTTTVRRIKIDIL